MKIEQYQHFVAALRRLGEGQGARCTPNNGRLPAGEPLPDDAYVMAAAVGMTLLIHLREMAKTKNLSPNEVQTMLDGFRDAAQIEEVETPMGGIVYQRKVQVAA